MKLRNKKTGEIKDACEVLDMKQDDGVLYKYYSLAELNKEWEDYEEPKKYYWVSPLEQGIACDEDADDGVDKMNKEIGNYFETGEEAKQAVKKLKAWKRLKSCKFRFKGWRTADLGADKYYFVITAESDDAGKGDLDLLFGGEK